MCKQLVYTGTCGPQDMETHLLEVVISTESVIIIRTTVVQMQVQSHHFRLGERCDTDNNPAMPQIPDTHHCARMKMNNS